MSTSPSRLGAGDILDGKYEILGHLGSGGMGEVYAARRLTLGDTVAIKRLLPNCDSREDRIRFLTEARAAAHIRHPNVVRVFDFGEQADGSPFMVMEYLNGHDLSAYLTAHAPLSAERALEIFSGICAAVEAGHRRGIVHRDLKPANVMLAGNDDGSEIVKVLDFGLARMLAAAEPEITTPGVIIGTCNYMAPEQVTDQAIVPATDVWALGVLLYVMVTGKMPFAAKAPIDILTKVRRGTYPPPRQYVPTLPASVAEAIKAALQQKPAARPQSPERLARLAGGFLEQSRARTPSTHTMPAQTVEIPFTEPTRTTSLGAVSATAQVLYPRFDCFVGREPHLERLRQEYASVIAGHGRITVVTGEPGVGKTRLAAEFVRWAQEQGAVVLEGRFFDYQGSRPPALDTFSAMLGYSSGDLLGGAHGPGAVPVAALVDTAENQRWRAFSAIGEALAACAGSRPLVLGLHDLQWAGRVELALIEYLFQVLGARGTMILCTARTVDGASELGRWLQTQANRRTQTSVVVGPFDDDGVRAWLRAAFGRVALRAQDLRKLVRATGGNPYYLAEVARHLMTSGTLAGSEHGPGWRCAPLDEVELPESLTNVVRGRIASLTSDERGVLEVAALIGDGFRFDIVKAATGMDEDALDDLLENAVRDRWLRDAGVGSGNDYRFTSAMLRSVLRNEMSGRRRRRGHRSVVTALQSLHTGNAERIAPMLAYHYDAMGEWQQAFEWGLRAVSTALERYDNDMAEIALVRAQNACEQRQQAGERIDPIAEITLDALAGELYLRVGRLAEAREILTRVTFDDRLAERDDLRVKAWLELALCEIQLGEFAAAVNTARRGAAAAHDAGDRTSALTARLLVGRALNKLGRSAEVAAELGAVLADLSPDDPAWLRSEAHIRYAWHQLRAAAWAEAEEHATRAVDLARREGDLLAHCKAIMCKAAVFGERGERERGKPLEREALELARRLALRRFEAIILANMGENHFWLDEYEESLACLTEALDIFIEIQGRAAEGDCRVNVGRTLLALGERAQAIEMLERGRDLCRSTGRAEYEGIAMMHLGNAHLQAGDSDAARASFAQAVQCLEGIGSHNLWQAELGSAQAARQAGDDDDALHLIVGALSHIEEQRKQLPAGASRDGFERSVRPAYELYEMLTRPA